MVICHAEHAMPNWSCRCAHVQLGQVTFAVLPHDMHALHIEQCNPHLLYGFNDRCRH